jgi:hypothetical protein
VRHTPERSNPYAPVPDLTVKREVPGQVDADGLGTGVGPGWIWLDLPGLD